MLNNQYFSQIEDYMSYVKNFKFSHFNIISVNVRSISSINKFNKFKTIINSFPQLPNVIAIQETWFSSDLVQIYGIPGYNCIHCCRGDSYGGTSVYIRENFQFTVNVCESKMFCEMIVLTLENYKIYGKPVKIISFYRSQKCDINTFYNLIENLLNLYGRESCIIVGDSNVDFLDNTQSDEFSNLLSNFDFKNCHNLVTRPASGTCIDNVYSNISNSFFISSTECDISDHNMVTCLIRSDVNNPKNFEIIQKRCDYAKFRVVFQNNVSINNTGDPSADTTRLIECLSSACKSSTVEVKRKKALKSEIAPWVNDNLQSLILFKQKLLKQRRKNRNNLDIQNKLNRISKVIKKACQESMNNYYKDNISKIQHDPKKCWRFLNESLGRNKKQQVSLVNSDGRLIMDDTTKCNLLNQYFIQAPKSIKQQINSSPLDSCNSLRTLNRHNGTFHFQYSTIEEILLIMSELSINKSPGHDNLSPRLFKVCRQEISPHLLRIFNNIISTSEYPTILKISKIVPIPKEINANVEDKYRPIALLSVIDKIFEKLIHQQLDTYLENNKLLYDCQFGFRKGSGTENAVVNVISNICNGLDQGLNGVAGIFYDFSKAFDLVDHEILICKLQYYGIMGGAINLIKSYLYNRKQYVELNDCKSFLGVVENGVPQGSVLGPLLFVIYINDIMNLQLYGKLYMYADDISLFYPYKHEAALKPYMERDASLIFEYSRLNKLVINTKKTKLVRFKPRLTNDAGSFSIFVNGQEIFESQSVKYLGLHLQSNLSWNLHIQELRSKISPAVGLLYKFKNKFDQQTKLLLYQALMQSHINYLLIIYGSKNSTDLKSLQRVQNRALKVIYNLPLLYSTLSLYKDVTKTILPIIGLYKMRVLMFVFKSLQSIGRNAIHFTRNQNNFNTRNCSNLRVARCRLETTKQGIQYIGPLEFNNLPPNLKNTQRISIFKENLKKYLLQNLEMLIM